MTTELVTSITALNRSKETADRGTLDEIKKQRDLYRKTLYTFAEMLKSLHEKKSSLQGRVSFNGVHQDLNDRISAVPDMLPEPNDAIALVKEIDTATEQLTEQLIEQCSRQRDIYREGVYKLKEAIASCRHTLSELEKRIPTTPKAVSRAPEAALSPNAREKRQQIDMLRKRVEQVNNVRIAGDDRDAAIQNYTFLLFVQEKNRNNEPVDLEKFNSTDLSAQDKILLEKAAQKALQTMDPKSTDPYNLEGLFRTKERILNEKINIANHLRNLFGTTSPGITQMEGRAEKLFGHFFALLKQRNQTQSTGEADYRDFIFSHIGFLAGDLLLAEEIYKKCIAYYEKENRGSNDPQIISINATLSQIKEVQELFLTLLQKCKVN